jgi:hypothetical protein
MQVPAGIRKVASQPQATPVRRPRAECAEHAPCLCVSECLAPEVSAEARATHCEISAVPEPDALTSCTITHCSNVCN